MSGQRTRTPPALPPVPDLAVDLAALLVQVPKGCVTTYGDLAEALGDRTAARWVGEFLVDHPHSLGCPCHRVVLRTGAPGKYIAGSSDDKLARLAREGVPATGGLVDLEKFGYRTFAGPRPLGALREFQESLPDFLELTPLATVPERVAAVDVAYGSSGVGAAALAVTDAASGELLHMAVIRKEVRFPYITGYLGFREIELLLAVIDEASKQFDLPEVILVDGNGRLHPRRAGIATQLGIVSGRTTAGIGKKLICGQVDLAGLKAGGMRPVIYEGETLGAAVVSTDASSPVFVSSGHRIDLAGAVRLVQSLFRGHRLPEPIYHADRLSKTAARS